MNSNSRRLVLVAIVAVLSAITYWMRHSPGQGASRSEDQLLQVGTLKLTPCVIGDRTADGVPSEPAYCTRYSVPENWDAPTGVHIDLRVAIVKSETAGPLPDLVTFLDGGPGGAATDDYPEVAAAFEPLRARHHILLIDQRGTGHSHALTCPQLPTDSRSLPAAGEQTLEAALAQLRRCLDELRQHTAVERYTTSAAVRDLEAVRQALGAPALDIIGISYGTRVAQQYVARYPRAVRSLVLDGPVPNQLALSSGDARNLEHTLKALFGVCRAGAQCAARFGDPYATLYRLRDALRAQPRAVELRDPVSFALLHLTFTAQDLAAIVRFYAYSPTTAALLPLMLDEADRGNYAPLLGQKKWLTEDLGDHITSGMQLSVLCSEDADLLSPQREDQDTLLGNELINEISAACAFWPHERRPVDFHAPLIAAVPALVLAGEFDPVTPPGYGAEVVRHLSHARLLVVAGQGHSVSRVGCMPELLRRFIATPDPSALDAHCLQPLGLVAPFLDYSGPGP